MISEHAILNYLAQSRNWSLVEHGSMVVGWHSVYKGRLRDYHVYLNVDEQWFYMQCQLLKAEVTRECRAALYEYLLRANDQLFMAKFVLFRPPTAASLDLVMLTVECSVDSLDSSLFWLMTEAIATYAEQYGREIQAIALDEKVAALVHQSEWAVSNSQNSTFNYSQ